MTILLIPPSFNIITLKFSNSLCCNLTLQLRTENEGKKENKVIAIDGKTLRGAIGSNLKGMTHILHAWSVENGICIGQQAVKDKTNELTAMEPLLKILDLKGCIVTTDAIHSHKGTAKAIIEQGRDYVLPIKGNNCQTKSWLGHIMRQPCLLYRVVFVSKSHRVRSFHLKHNF